MSSSRNLRPRKTQVAAETEPNSDEDFVDNPVPQNATRPSKSQQGSKSKPGKRKQEEASVPSKKNKKQAEEPKETSTGKHASIPSRKNKKKAEEPKEDPTEEDPFDEPVQEKQKPSNVLKYLLGQERGESRVYKREVVGKTMASLVVQNVQKQEVFKVSSPFDRRITAMAWHPRFHTTLAVASKGGDIILWNHQNPTHEIFVKGLGAGGAIKDMKFDVQEKYYLYTCSIDGIFCRRDLRSETTLAYLNTGKSWCRWYTCLDSSVTNGLLLAGDNVGNVNLLTKDGELIWEKRLNKNKVHHVEFHTGQPWLFVTASLDNYVRLWDVRKIDDKSSSLAALQHDRGVNSACFSPCHGTRLLTSDQHSEIKIFSGPLWNLETSIVHPHRQFQHLTPIKADWHPLEDIVVVGRYPDPKLPGYTTSDPRSVDFFDASDGTLLCQIEPVGRSGIMSLNRFDPIGNVLASAMGQHILLWEPKYHETATCSRKSAEDLFKDAADNRRRGPPRNGDDDDEPKKKKKRAEPSTTRPKKAPK